MTNLEMRVSEVEKVLKTQRLLKKGQTLPRRATKKEEPLKTVQLFKSKRQEHILEALSFSNGAIMVALRTGSKESATYLMFIATPEKPVWCVSVASNFTDRCSALMIDIWNKMPPRKNVDEGEFTQKNALLALELLTKSFASQPAD